MRKRAASTSSDDDADAIERKRQLSEAAIGGAAVVAESKKSNVKAPAAAEDHKNGPLSASAQSKAKTGEDARSVMSRPSLRALVFCDGDVGNDDDAWSRERKRENDEFQRHATLKLHAFLDGTVGASLASDV
eukprot:Opistho-2@76353